MICSGNSFQKTGFTIVCLHKLIRDACGELEQLIQLLESLHKKERVELRNLTRPTKEKDLRKAYVNLRKKQASLSEASEMLTKYASHLQAK